MRKLTDQQAVARRRRVRQQTFTTASTLALAGVLPGLRKDKFYIKGKTRVILKCLFDDVAGSGGMRISNDRVRTIAVACTVTVRTSGTR